MPWLSWTRVGCGANRLSRAEGKGVELVTVSPQIGHNGGPRMPLARKLSAPQLRALRMVRDHGNSAHGLYGNSAIGGWNNTVTWLRREALALWSPGYGREVLTSRGERVLAAGRMVE